MAFTLIAARPEVMAGVPCVAGTRIPVTAVVGMVADGMTWDEIVEAFPQLSHDAIRQALRFAAARVDEQEIELPRSGVKLLIDEGISHQVAAALVDAGYDATHVGDHRLLGAPDSEVLERARVDGSVLICLDTDFGALLAISGAAEPSVVLLRRQSHRPSDQAERLALVLPVVAEALDHGAIVVVAGDLIRVRSLPIGGDR